MSTPFCFIGLGNPETKHANTRHNLGFMALDALATAWHLPAFQNQEQYHGQTTAKQDGEQTIWLLKPMTYMNDSGRSVQAFTGFYHITPNNLWVVHDDLDLPFGTIRLQRNASAAGHNGVDSIIETLHTKDFWRVRCGIGRAQQMDANADGKVDSREWAMAKYTGADYVLDDFDASQKVQLQTTFLPKIVEAITLILSQGPERAATTINAKTA